MQLLFVPLWQMASEQKLSSDLQGQLRGAISDNTRMTLEMTRLQREMQVQADKHELEIERVREEVSFDIYATPVIVF